MSRTLLLRSISAILPVDADYLETAIENGNVGTERLDLSVSSADFLTSGLAEWVWRHLQEHLRCVYHPNQPDLSDRRQWFKYWNFSKNGRLTRGEVLRAVLRSFGVGSLDTDRQQNLRGQLERLWEARCTQRSKEFGCCDPNAVTCDEFVANGGLGDLLQEAFSLEPGGQGLHPQPAEAGVDIASSRIMSLLPGRHPGLHGRAPKSRSKPQSAGRPSTPAPRIAWNEPPPDLDVPSELPPDISASYGALMRPPPASTATSIRRERTREDREGEEGQDENEEEEEEEEEGEEEEEEEGISDELLSSEEIESWTDAVDVPSLECLDDEPRVLPLPWHPHCTEQVQRGLQTQDSLTARVRKSSIISL